MSEGKRSAEYRELLNKIYGEAVVNSFVDPLSGETPKKFEPDRLNKFIETRKTKNGKQWEENEGCDKCSKECENFLKRKMDFPGWLGKLDFSKKNAKKIMLIGEDVGPSVETYINIAYSLGLDKIEEDGEVKKIQADGTERTDLNNLLWKILKKIFPEKIEGMNGLEWVKKNIYITDICKCGATELAKNQQQSNTTLTEKLQKANPKKVRDIFWGGCSKEYLIDEIKLVKPKVIIFQGNPSYNYAKKLFKFMGWQEDNEVANNYRIQGTENFPKFGHIELGDMNVNFLKIFFIKIFHSSKLNLRHDRWNDENIAIFNKLVADKIIAELGT